MTVIMSGVIAIIIAYLLGSIPGAYIATRLQTGKDIRLLGSGNVGANNVFREVGFKAALFSGIVDVTKGIIAVLIAQRVFGFPSMQLADPPQLLILAAALAAVAGHIWSIYLKFTGGNGLATTIGILVILMPQELLIALAITLVLIIVTRNPVLSVNISLFFSVPVSAWFLEYSRLYVLFPVVLAVILVLHFLPTAKTALSEIGHGENLLNELMRRDRARK